MALFYYDRNALRDPGLLIPKRAPLVTVQLDPSSPLIGPNKAVALYPTTGVVTNFNGIPHSRGVMVDTGCSIIRHRGVPVFYTNGSGDTHWTFGYNHAPAGLPITLAMVCWHPTIAAANNHYHTSMVDTDYGGGQLYLGTDGKLNVWIGDCVGMGPGNRKSGSGDSVVPDESWAVVSITWRSASDQSAFVNGTKQTLSLTGTVSSMSGACGIASLGRQPSGSPEHRVNYTSLALCVHGAWSDEQHLAFLKDPYQVLKAA